jgi:glycosyltransferase involved in cell wall biosynthesis
VVEAHPADFFRTAGHQTFLNAMWMGKPFVMADSKSAIGYFESGRHWFVVDAGDAPGMREKVRLLLEDRALAARTGEEAREVATEPRYRTLNCMQSIYNIAIEIEAKKHGIDASSVQLSLY